MTTKDMIEEVRKDVKGIMKILSGNGEKGLCEQVRTNEAAIEDHLAEAPIVTVPLKKFSVKEWIPVIIAGIAFLGMVLNLIKPDQMFKLLSRLAGIQ